MRAQRLHPMWGRSKSESRAFRESKSIFNYLLWRERRQKRILVLLLLFFVVLNGVLFTIAAGQQAEILRLQLLQQKGIIELPQEEPAQKVYRL